MTAEHRYRFGFDIGGTFTDFVLYDEQTGRVETYKTLTTPANPSQAVQEGWQVLLERVHARAEAVEMAIHATTLITNALIERKGARAALLTTQGYKDTLDTQREMRYDIFDLHSPPVEPLIPRSLRFEVREPLDSFGEVVVPLDDTGLREAIEWLRAANVEAVAVTYLHSYKNAAHERLTGEALAREMPALHVTLSCEVAPEIREYERMSTAAANAYVQPLTVRYLQQMEKDLLDRGFQRRLYLMLSSGGITTTQTASRFRVRTVESGPAAGAQAAVFYGERLGLRDLVAFDMGGTTAKMCLIEDGRPAMAHTFEIARVHRFKRGSGLPVQIPAIELIEIGAGGGSIAWIDQTGLLKVGPESVGADPGPACYGLGGTLPTVTDADLLLGYLNPDYFLGGRMQISAEKAQAAVAPLAEAMHLSSAHAAWGIHHIVNENMISATREHVAERGEDPRRLALLAFGGAGPVHAYSIARALKMKGYICPAGAGVVSALGLLTAPAAFEYARTYVARLTPERLAQLDQVFAALEAEGRAQLAEAGVAEADMTFERSADLRHLGQGHEVTVDLPWQRLEDVELDRQLRPHFYDRYSVLYGHAHPHLDLEIRTCRLRAAGPRPKIELPGGPSAGGDSGGALKGHRPIYLAAARDFVSVPIYDRELLPAGARIRGPAIAEEKDSTAVVADRAEAVIDRYRNLVVMFFDQP